MSESNFTRRNVLKTGAALAGAGAGQPGAVRAGLGPGLAVEAREAGAKLQLLRWKRFIQSEEDAFMALVAAFTKATGVEVTVLNESLDDVQPKASVAANTGQGPDLFWGLYSLPHLFPDKCVDVTDVADYLGKKYGGWVDSARHLRQERRQVDRHPGGLQRQRHQLPPEHDREGGLQGGPEGQRRASWS